MSADFIPFAEPSVGEAEIAEVVDTLRSRWINTGPRATRFEAEFRDRVGAPAALAVNSGTAALHVALAALGIGEGDHVITSAMTFCSAVHAIEHTGACPELVDIEPETLNIDPTHLETALKRASGGRVAVMPVHLYGHPYDLDAVLGLAARVGAPVVEDAAHAFGSEYRGRRIGSFAQSAPVPLISCFSFYATKNLTTGDGGMVTGPAPLIDEARVWSLHGMNSGAANRHGPGAPWRYEVSCAGFKYNMTDMQAAIGLAQLRQIHAFQRRRDEIAARYNAAFADCPDLQLPACQAHIRHAWHLYEIRLRLERLRIDRDTFMRELQARGVGTSVHFMPVHTLRYYREKYGFRPEDFPIAFREGERIISLPLYPTLSEERVERVVAAVLDVVAHHRSRSAVGSSHSSA